MREIKFRAWDKKNGYMAEIDGDYLYVANGNVYEVREVSRHYQTYMSKKDVTENYEVMQYTGLKDKNGKEIYEGDILDGSWINPMSQEKVTRHYKITFDKGKYNAELIGHHPYGSTMLYFENEKGEVIGNIYENPELLHADGWEDGQ